MKRKPTIQILTSLFFLVLIFSCGTSPQARATIADAAPAPVEAASGTSAQRQPGGQERMLAYSAYITLETRNVEEVMDQVRGIPEEFDGYLVRFDDDVCEMRVPVSVFENALLEIAEIARVRSRSVQATDITERYMNNQIRLENAYAARERFLELIEQAEDVLTVVEIERELQRLNSQIDTMEAQQRSMDRMVAMSFIRVQVVEKVVPGPLGWIFYGLWHTVKWLFVW
ncbi:MAG: DUF4349 domain-containing protein [Spirochaetia bacterium]